MNHNNKSLDTCGCCSGTENPTPVSIKNRPGLSALVYRAGTHGQFKTAMLNHLSRHQGLRELTVREDDDFSIALLDAWAVTSDVLTFYQERIANEGFLRTAKERLSILQLARLIGYQLSPGVAANAYLAFTIEEAPAAAVSSAAAAAAGTTGTAAADDPERVTIDIGTQVQSVPGQDELPQTFETVEKIEARKELNAVKPRLTNPHTLETNTSLLYIKGLTTELKKGDMLYFDLDGNGDPMFCRAAYVTTRSEQDHTEVGLSSLLDISGKFPNPLFNDIDDSAPALDPFTELYQDMAQPLNAAYLSAEAKAKKFKVSDIFANLGALQPPPANVTVFRDRASIFGHNAPAWNTLPYSLTTGVYVYPNGSDEAGDFIAGPLTGMQNNWVDDVTIYEGSGDKIHIYLDSTYPKIVKDSWVLLKDDSNCQLYQVVDTCELSKSEFTMNAKVTRLTLDVTNLTSGEEDVLDGFKIRETAVYVQSEELPLAPVPIKTEVKDNQIKLNDWIDGLYQGQNIIVCGESHTTRGTNACELVTIEEVLHDLSDDGCTQIKLKEGLKNQFVRNTVTINANVALATHGEAVTEVLGSGDASQGFRKFYLRQNPLTYISSSKPGGVETTLKVRVNDILWEEVSSFYGRGPDERIYITRQDNDGKTYVLFGDGITGARLPSGRENITAAYRKGIGEDAMVNPGQLSLLMTRPYGVKAVNNPLAASGAADPEKLEQARKNSPFTVLTLDRVVSLRDFEDFAYAFAGIEKARADWVWDVETRLVYITVAGAKGKAVEKTSTLYKNLQDAIESSGTGRQPFRIESYVSRSFFIKAGIKIDSRYIKEKVIKQVKTTLETVFSFDRRHLAQLVTKSEVLAVIQAVPGVEAVDLDALYLSGGDQVANDYLDAPKGRWDRGCNQPAPAELLTLSPIGVTITLMETKK
jgi:hypothetical protein